MSNIKNLSYKALENWLTKQGEKSFRAGQIFYWLFANQLQPILVGMPFGMFVITALIVIEFICLILLYKFHEN